MTPNDAVVIVDGSIASLNVAVTLFVRQLPVLASTGLTETIVGAVTFAVLPVVNVQT